MKRIQLEFLSDGFHDLLCSDPVAKEVETAAEKIADIATTTSVEIVRKQTRFDSPRFVVKGPKIGGYGGGRYIAYVSADNQGARWDAIYNHRLETAIWEAQV